MCYLCKRQKILRILELVGVFLATNFSVLSKIVMSACALVSQAAGVALSDAQLWMRVPQALPCPVSLGALFVCCVRPPSMCSTYRVAEGACSGEKALRRQHLLPLALLGVEQLFVSLYLRSPALWNCADSVCSCTLKREHFTSLCNRGFQTLFKGPDFDLPYTHVSRRWWELLFTYTCETRFSCNLV